MENRILVTGGSGQVATGLYELIKEWELDLTKVYSLDIVKPKVEFEGINYIEGSFVYNLDDLLLEYEINTIIHLIPESSLPIWNACEKMPWKMNYIDASVYVSNYSSNLDYSHLLLSNFKKFDRVRGQYQNIEGLSSSGFNPGVVNFLFKKAIEQYGTHGLKAAYVIEHDSYIPEGVKDDSKIYVTWGGEACPSECAEPPIWFRDGNPITITDKSCNTPFKFIMGGKEYEGMAVIHEECYQLSKRYGIETTFLYSLPTDTVNKIKKYGDEYSDEDVVVMSPLSFNMKGSDQLGIKLVYSHHEVNITNTNTGTELVSGVTRQVSAGVFAAFYAFMNTSHNEGIEWIDEYFKYPTFSNLYEDTLNEILEFETEVVPSSMGTLKNRTSKKYDEVILAPKFEKIKDIESLERVKKYTFPDYYWADFSFDFEENIDVYYKKVYAHFNGVTFDSYEEGLEKIYAYIEKCVKDPSITGSPYIDPELLSLTYLEEVLLLEGCLQNNIHTFMFEYFEPLCEKSKEVEDIYFEAVKMYEYGGYYDYIR